MKQTDPEILSKVAIVLLMGTLVFFLISTMSNFSGAYMEKQANNIEKIIDKALVQCYALEGEYPLEVQYVEKYGVIFDENKYLYHYEWYGANLKPTVIVIEK